MGLGLGVRVRVGVGVGVRVRVRVRVWVGVRVRVGVRGQRHAGSEVPDVARVAVGGAAGTLGEVEPHPKLPTVDLPPAASDRLLHCA